MSHVAGPIGKDWANLTQPEQRFRPGLATPHFSGRSLVPTWRALKSALRLRVWATAARIDGWGASMPQNLRLRSLSLLRAGKGHHRRAANWLIETPGREAHGAIEVQLGGQRGRHRRPPTNMAGLGCLERTAGMGFALIALNSVSRVQSVGSWRNRFGSHLNLSGRYIFDHKCFAERSPFCQGIVTVSPSC